MFPRSSDYHVANNPSSLANQSWDLVVRVDQPQLQLIGEVWQVPGIKIFAPNLSQTILSVLARRDLFTAAQKLSGLLWGSSVCVLTDKETGDRLFYPDGAYTTRLFFAKSDGKVLISTEIEDLVAVLGLEWNLEFLLHFSATQFGQRGGTAFVGVHVVPPGCALLVPMSNEPRVTKQLWPTPQSNTRVSCHNAISEVYDHLTTTQKSFALALSGGIDSSASGIFARNSLGPDASLRAVHLHTSLSPDYQEKAFAEQIAREINAELIPIDIELSLPFSDIEPKVLPKTLSQEMMFIGTNRAIERELGDDVTLLEGEGGDLLFHAVPDVDIIDDAFADGGFKLAMATTERLARLHNSSIVRLLARAAFRRVSLAGANEHLQGVAGEIFTKMPTLSKDSREMSAVGRRDRDLIGALGRLLEVTAPTYAVGIKRINPFLTQPIITAALGLKSYESFSEMNDRVVLRRLASHHCESEVLWRRTKGSFNAGILKGLQVHRDNYFDLVKNGVLFNNGLIKMEGVERALREVDVGQSPAGITLALLGCTEIYCAAWKRSLTGRTDKVSMVHELKA